MAEEDKTPRYDIEALKVEAKRRREKDIAGFNVWMEEISPERKELYLKLPVISSDVQNSEGEPGCVLRQCRFALEVVDSLESVDGRRLVPRGIGIHGESPVVYFRVSNDPIKDGARNFEEFTQVPPRTRGENDQYFCDVDTTEFGLAATEGGIMKFKLDREKVEDVIKWMKE